MNNNAISYGDDNSMSVALHEAGKFLTFPRRFVHSIDWRNCYDTCTGGFNRRTYD